MGKQIRTSRIKGGMNCRASDDLVGVIGKDEVGECINLSLSNANPVTGLSGAVRTKGVVGRVDKRFKPMELEKNRNSRMLSSGHFECSEPPNSIRSQ
jgi:hypothetical protein